MHRLFHDYFWLYVVALIILTGAIVYLMPKLTKFLNRLLETKILGRAREEQAAKAAAKNKNRYKTF